LVWLALRSYERAVGLRRDDPALAAMGLKSVFLSARPIVLSLARFSNNRKVQRARPLGGLEQAKGISLASFSPSKIRATAGIARPPLFRRDLLAWLTYGPVGARG
jgi:hypothetical protein